MALREENGSKEIFGKIHTYIYAFDSRLHDLNLIYFICTVCAFAGIEPMTFVLQTQCFTSSAKKHFK